MMASLKQVDPVPDAKPVTLEEGISLLEAGQGQGLVVDLGNGRMASADGHRGTDGLLQRLRGHRMMLSLASGGADLSRFEGMNDSLIVAPLVQEILDAAAQKD